MLFYFTFVVQTNEKPTIYSAGKDQAGAEGVYVFLSLPPQKTGKMGMSRIVPGL